MSKHSRDRSRNQTQLRHRRDEQAFLFDRDLTVCLGEIDRDKWEFAISTCGGDVALAARQCGLAEVPRGAKALWGRSAEEARSTYNRWRKRRGK
ncbi:MAG: hypothetical protein ABIF77_12825 [bacterium]